MSRARRDDGADLCPECAIREGATARYADYAGGIMFRFFGQYIFYPTHKLASHSEHDLRGSKIPSGIYHWARRRNSAS